MNTSEILDKAADLIEQRGHAKGWYCDESGALCAIGATLAAVGIEPLPYVDCDGREERFPGFGEGRRWNDAHDAWERLAVELNEWLPEWNDEDERTPSEVVAAFRSAAEAARAER